MHVVVADSDPEQRKRSAEAALAAAASLDMHVDVHQASDGTTALALCSDHRPRLLVTEILLEGLSGLALLRRLRSDYGKITQVVFVTAMARETDRYWGLRSGAHAYLGKPCDGEVLRERLRRLLHEGAAAGPDALGPL